MGNKIHHYSKYDRLTVFNFIVDYKTRNDGTSPSMREIMEACDISTLSIVHYILADLVDMNLIEKGGTRNIKVVGGSWVYEMPKL